MSKSSRSSAGTENITLSGSIQRPRVGRERDASQLQRQSSRDKREVTEMWLLLADCCSIKWSEKWDGAERDRKTRPGRPTSCTHIHISVSDIWIKVSGKLWSWSLRQRCCFYASAAVTAVDRAGVFLGHLSVSTSSRGNFFKYATNIRLDSVMFLQKTFWSLLRTRRNRGWYCSGETNHRCPLSNCAHRRDLWVKWTKTSHLWWWMDEEEQHFDPEIKGKSKVRPATNNYLYNWWCL